MTVRSVDSRLPGQVERIPVRVEFDPSEKCSVDSSARAESDINLIVARYKKTGVLPGAARAAAARYGDFSQVPDFAEMQIRVMAASEMFAALPAKVRRVFNNDPSEFLAAASTPEGVELLKTLGLGNPDAAPAPSVPAPAPVVDAGLEAAKAAKAASAKPEVESGGQP